MQVNEDIVKTMDKIETVNWGKAEQVEWLAKEQDIRVELSIDLTRWGEIKHDLYTVLMDKTEGDANMLSENDNRDGLMAYMRVNKWYTEQSGQGLADRREPIIRPEEVKKECDIFRAVQIWEEELRELRKISGESIMGEMLMKTALKKICTGQIKQYVDLKEDKMTYQELRDDVMAFAARKRPEGEKARNTAGMDVGELTEELHKLMGLAQGNNYEFNGQQGWGKGQGAGQQPEQSEAKQVAELMLNVLTKGKGKGKFGKGKGGKGCWTCGGNHMAKNCPKGKGKGGYMWGWPGGKGNRWSPGGFKGDCWNCGLKGHSQRYCPQPKGAKGKGKGINMLEGTAKEVSLGGGQEPTGPPGTAQPEPEAGAVSDGHNQKLQMQQGTCYNEYWAPGYMQPCDQWYPWTDTMGVYSVEQATAEELEWVKKQAEQKNAERIEEVKELIVSEVVSTINTITPENVNMSGIPKLTGEQRAQIRERLASKFDKTHIRYKVCPDSGCWKLVANKEFAPHVGVTESEESRNGIHYKCANKTFVANEGEKVVKGEDINGNLLNSNWQIADITKPLAGVIEMVKAGNRVVFDREEGENVSSILNKKTGVLIPI